MALDKIAIRHAPLSGRVVLARFGKNPSVALETRDATNDFWQALVACAFDGKIPEKGEEAEIDFGGGDQQFVLTLRRKAD